MNNCIAMIGEGYFILIAQKALLIAFANLATTSWCLMKKFSLKGSEASQVDSFVFRSARGSVPI